MQLTILRKIAKNKLSWLLFVIFSAIASGLIIIRLFSRFKSTWATFYLAAIMTPFAMLIFGNSKRLLLALLVICLPITVDQTPFYTWNPGGAGGYVISLFDMTLLALYLLWFAELISEKKLHDIKLCPSISLPAFFLIFIACLSIIPASRPEFSTYEIVEVIKMYMAFIYLVNNVKTENDVKFVISIFIASLLFEGLLGWAQHHYGEPLLPTALGGSRWMEHRVTGSWTSYNDFAWYLTCFLPIAFCMLFSEIKLLLKLICLFTLIMGFGALIWTGSRSGWISYGVSIIFAAPFVLSKIKGKIDLFKVFAAIMVLLVFLSPLFPRLYTKIYGRFTRDDKGAAASRWPQFHIALNIIKKNPIIGIGVNNYVQVMRDYDDTLEGIDSITHNAVHNIFLKIAAEMGIFGLAAFLWFIAVIFIKGFKFIISHEGLNVYSVIGMISGLLAFLVHGLFDVEGIGGKLFMFIWFFAGIIAAIDRIYIEKSLKIKSPVSIGTAIASK